MTKALELKRGDELHACTEVIMSAGQDMMKAFYAAGVAFKKVRDEELWKDAHESFPAYYAELGFDKARVSRAIATVEKLGLKEVVRLQLGKLHAILPHVTSDNKEEMVSLAENLSTSDLYHQLKVKRVAQVDKTLPEPPKTYPCIECGGTKGIRFIDLCHCRMNKEQAKHIQLLIDKVENDDYEI